MCFSYSVVFLFKMRIYDGAPFEDMCCSFHERWPVSLNDEATGDNFPDVKLNQKECVKV